MIPRGSKDQNSRVRKKSITVKSVTIKTNAEFVVLKCFQEIIRILNMKDVTKLIVEFVVMISKQREVNAS